MTYTSNSSLLRRLLIPCALLTAGATAAQAQVVFSTDFESGLPAEISAPGAAIEGVQGYAGLGPVGRQFDGSFLRYSAVTVQPTTLTLTGLPQHTSIDLSFLLGVIDSWDGTELLWISIDGQLFFSHWFQLALGDSSSYVAPPGGLLSSGTDLGFTSGGFYNRDRAYDMGVEPGLRAIPHTASTVTIEWMLDAISGSAASNWQGGADESWALEEITVSVSNAPTTIGNASCTPAVANSTGLPGLLTASGSLFALLNDVTLEVSQLPADQFGYFLNSQALGTPTMPGGSEGNLCLTGAMGEYANAVFDSGFSGSASLALDLLQTPTPNGATAVLAGETWHFQCWYRDRNPGTTSNFTNALTVEFR